MSSNKKSPPTTSPAAHPPCPLGQLYQWDCALSSNRNRRRDEVIHCRPVPRIYRLCPNRPAVEVTHDVRFDEHGRAYEIGGPTKAAAKHATTNPLAAERHAV